jgi:hypothetical protein
MVPLTIVPTRNVLGAFGPLPRFKGKAYDVQASGPDLTELVRTGGVQGASDRHVSRTNEDASDLKTWMLSVSQVWMRMRSIMMPNRWLSQ